VTAHRAFHHVSHSDIDRGRQYVYCGALESTTREVNTMGKGDKRTRKGKIFKSSYGKTRPHRVAKKAPAKPAGRKS
jgi:30S ribosomal protein S31